MESVNAIDLVVEHVAQIKNIHLHPVSLCSWPGAGRIHINSQQGNSSFSAWHLEETLPPYLLSFSFTCGQIQCFSTSSTFLPMHVSSSPEHHFPYFPHNQNSLKEGFCPLKPQVCSLYLYYILNTALLKSLKNSGPKVLSMQQTTAFWSVCFSAHRNREVRDGMPSSTTKTCILWPKSEYVQTPKAKWAKPVIKAQY